MVFNLKMSSKMVNFLIIIDSLIKMVLMVVISLIIFGYILVLKKC